MCKRLLVCFVVLLLAGAQSFAANPVGIFDDTMDVGTAGNPRGIGIVQQLLGGGDNYRLTGGGSDVWDSQDHMLFAYKGLSGDWRMSADFAWQTAGDWWSKTGVMVRASTAAESAYWGTMITNTLQGHNETVFQGRNSTWEGSWGNSTGQVGTPARLGIQRFDIGYANISIVESIADFGSGWQMLGNAVTMNLPQTAVYGAFLTSHNNDWMAQANVSNVSYQQNPAMFTKITTVDNPGGNCMQQPGFMVRTIQRSPWATGSWGYDQMNELLSTGSCGGELGYQDYPPGKRIEQLVNLFDNDGGHGAFSADNGYPDHSFPGLHPEPWKTIPSGDPLYDNGVDNYATEVIACIQLTAGYHIIGANSDDGTIIKIGGIEIGRTGEWKGDSTVDFLFKVLTAGLYTFEARMLEGGGGSSLELHEVLADGTRILLGDVDHGGSPVYVPEPATVALLGLGGMSLLGIRRKR